MVTDEATLKRQKRFRERRINEGQKRVAVWLTPEALAALEFLKSQEVGASDSSVISQALLTVVDVVKQKRPDLPDSPAVIQKRLEDVLQSFRELKPDIQLHAILAFAILGNRSEIEMNQLAEDVGKSRLVTMWDLQDFQEPPHGRNAAMGLVQFEHPLGARGQSGPMRLTPKGEAFVRRLGEIMLGIPSEPKRPSGQVVPPGPE
ncbi:MAG: hypothetical protein HQL63_05650 [Magnetococcales bacterium]|nr:hypothetical protein [Magnetococcales bacterium]MBF0321774.1 hypothetical protein [Magnetococcales bacterium]